MICRYKNITLTVHGLIQKNEQNQAELKKYDLEDKLKDILSKIQSSVSIKKEQDNYIIEGNNLDIDLSNGKKLRLTKKTRTSISITIV